jgi:alkanesulfonate monooxygenase SsuD/methylene tetrahydromethanopterin reductase-like flavin-dependent oxidoreductase (luciferase family)
MELAGEIADGLHTACAYSPEALAYAVDHFQTGAERAGRSPTALTSATLCSARSHRMPTSRAAPEESSPRSTFHPCPRPSSRGTG